MFGRQFAWVSSIAFGLMLVGCVTAAAEKDKSIGKVELLKPFQYASVPVSTSMWSFKLAALAKIDPTNPSPDGRDNQTLSLFGREDLIAHSSGDFKSTDCAPLNPPIDVLAAIEDRARATSVVIINESHERSEHRGFTAEVARRLRPLGYDTLALETLATSHLDTPERYRPPFLREPGLPYFDDADGFYLSEAGFGRLGRLAKKLGYRLLQYEPNHDNRNSSLARQEQIARREEGQARGLASFLKEHPTAKLLVHVGYSHAGEVPMADETRWMAARLKEQTGIDPLTISQTTCRGGGEKLRASVLPASEPPGRFDLVIDHPKARFEAHRPEWRKLAGDQLVAIPEELRPLVGWRVIEARPIGEPVTSVPIDRVAIRPGESVALMLPPGRYTLRVIDPSVGQDAASGSGP